MRGRGLAMGWGSWHSWQPSSDRIVGARQTEERRSAGRGVRSYSGWVGTVQYVRYSQAEFLPGGGAEGHVNTNKKDRVKQKDKYEEYE